MDAVNLHIRKRIRQQRRTLGLTLEDLAKAIGIHVSTMHDYERGEISISVSRLYRIGVVLRMPITSFFPDFGDNGDHLESMTESLELELVSAYCGMEPATLRRAFLLLAQSLSDNQETATDNASAAGISNQTKKIHHIQAAGRRTTVRLEKPVWDTLIVLAANRGISVDDLITEIDRHRAPTSTLTSSIRSYCLSALIAPTPKT